MTAALPITYRYDDAGAVWTALAGGRVIATIRLPQTPQERWTVTPAGGGNGVAFGSLQSVHGTWIQTLAAVEALRSEA
ncbi:MAG: hypothetical protein U0556_09735 [Dehalococcoidia bacterium]